MEQYIPKAAVLAEIERLQDAIRATAIDDRISKEQAEAYKVCVKLRSFVEDTLEVKEVDLEKYYHDFLQKEWFGRSCVRTISEMMAFTAKHFFELGMSVNNKA